MATLSPAGSETLHWAPTHDRSQIREARYGGPYEAAIPARIADLELALPDSVAAAVEAVTVAMVRFDADHASMDATAPVLRRCEAVASSAIENIDASARAVAEAELAPATGKTAARLIVTHTEAIDVGQRCAVVDTETIREMHAALLAGQDRHTPGRWRTCAVWIGGWTPCTAVFVAPAPVRVSEAMQDLAAFMVRDDLPRLAQIAVAHAQFETIHPFSDGNGRTGRALAAAMLRSTGVVRDVTVPLSVGLRADIGGYIRALTAFRAGDPVPIIEVFAAAGHRGVEAGTWVMQQLAQVRAGWDDRITARADAAVWRVADLLVSRPVINAAVVGQVLGVASDHPRRFLAPLLDAGIVVESTGRTRDRIWRAPDILAVLDDVR